MAVSVVMQQPDANTVCIHTCMGDSIRVGQCRQLHASCVIQRHEDCILGRATELLVIAPGGVAARGCDE